VPDDLRLPFGNVARQGGIELLDDLFRDAIGQSVSVFSALPLREL
jgi:hypothetical protein